MAGYYILSYSLDGEQWHRTGPMLWGSLRKCQRAIHKANSNAISAPMRAYLVEA